MRLITSDTKLLVCATDSATSAVAINGMSGWNMTEDRQAIDTTGIEDTNKQYRAGQADAQGSFNINVEDDDAGQEIIATAQATNSIIYLYYREQGTGAGLPQKKLPIQITSYGTDGSIDSALTRSVSWVAAGAVDNTAQPTA